MACLKAQKTRGLADGELGEEDFSEVDEELV
jgi:hypothetical protein